MHPMPARPFPTLLQRSVTPEPTAVSGAAAQAVPAELAEPPPPDVEWWDRHLLATGSYEADVKEGGVAIKESKV